MTELQRWTSGRWHPLSLGTFYKLQDDAVLVLAIARILFVVNSNSLSSSGSLKKIPTICSSSDNLAARAPAISYPSNFRRLRYADTIVTRSAHVHTEPVEFNE